MPTLKRQFFLTDLQSVAEDIRTIGLDLQSVAEDIRTIGLAGIRLGNRCRRPVVGCMISGGSDNTPRSGAII
jgi:hypothetical protein